jgi:Flp pilus assembly protein TadG
MRVAHKNRSESGTAALEFALVVFPIVLTLIGVVVIGINLGRAIQVGQIVRDADSMYVRGVDFSQTGAQNLLAQMGQNMNLQTGSTSSGLIILSQVQYVPTPIGCTGSACTGGSYQLAQQQIIGNTSLPGTHFPTTGTIPACTTTVITDCQDSQGNIQGYQTFAAAQISNFGSSLTLAPLGISYVAEAVFENGPNLQIWSSGSGFYAQAFF